MARATWLHSSLLSRALLPILSHETAISPSVSFLNRFGYPARRTYSTNHTRLLVTPVQAQPKRGITSKAEEVASVEDLRFEPPLKIVEYPDPILRARNKRIETFDDNLKKLVDEMIEVMNKTDGYGLSAPQVGVNVQLMVFNPAGEEDEGQEIVLRPESLKIDAQDINGARFTVDMSGLTARVFQHEFDHLQGILFFDRMTEEVLDSIRMELKELEKKYEEKTGLPSPEK
ncbi:hypothetical protein SLA2020_078480 [Shorea laevis]